jgi:hypothetical protein
MSDTTATFKVVPVEQPQDFFVPSSQTALDCTARFNGSVQAATDAVAAGDFAIPADTGYVFVRSARLSRERGYDVYFKIVWEELHKTSMPHATSENGACFFGGANSASTAAPAATHDASAPPVRVRAKAAPAQDADGWELTFDEETQLDYYINHNVHCTSWAVGPVPEKCVVSVDEHGRYMFGYPHQAVGGAPVYADPRLGDESLHWPPPPPYRSRVRVVASPLSPTSAAAAAAADGAAGSSIASGEAPPLYDDVDGLEDGGWPLPSPLPLPSACDAIVAAEPADLDLSVFTIPEMTEQEMIARAERESIESIELYQRGSMRQMSEAIRKSLQAALASQDLRDLPSISNEPQKEPNDATIAAAPGASTAAAPLAAAIAGGADAAAGPSSGGAVVPVRSVSVAVARKPRVVLEKLPNMADKWMELSADTGLAVAPGLYARYQTEPSGDDDQIRRDIGRTFAELENFANEAGRERLFRVLHAFSRACHDPACINNTELGYVQGMNCLAGFLLIMCNTENEAAEEAVFWLLVRLMMSRKYRVAGMFMEGMGGVFCAVEQVEWVVKKQMPDVWEALQASGVPTTAWLPQWILTLFAKQIVSSKPLAIQHIWTQIFKDGW